MSTAKALIKRKILVVDDEPEIVEFVSDALKNQGYVVVSATDGTEAKQKLQSGAEKFDLVVSDIRMPGASGVELLEIARVTHNGPPVILITGFSESLENKSAYERGAYGFLSKPFDLDGLMKMVRSALIVAKTEGIAGEAPQEEFARVPLEEFKHGSQLKTPIYCRLSDHHFAKLSEHGADLPEKFLIMLKKAKRSHLFVPRELYLKHLGFREALTWPRLDEKGDQEVREILTTIQESAIASPFTAALDAGTRSQSLSSMEAMGELIFENHEVRKTLQELRICSPELWIRSIESTVLALSVCHHIGWRSSGKLMRLAIAGLLQDVGLQKSPSLPRLLSFPCDSNYSVTPMKEWGPEDNDWLKHPVVSREIVAKLFPAQDEVVQIVSQQHERGDGQGFPNGFSRTKILPLAGVLSLSNWMTWVFHAMKTQVAPIVLLERIENETKGVWDSEVFNAFRESFGGST